MLNSLGRSINVLLLLLLVLLDRLGTSHQTPYFDRAPFQPKDYLQTHKTHQTMINTYCLPTFHHLKDPVAVAFQFPFYLFSSDLKSFEDAFKELFVLQFCMVGFSSKQRRW